MKIVLKNEDTCKDWPLAKNFEDGQVYKYEDYYYMGIRAENAKITVSSRDGVPFVNIKSGTIRPIPGNERIRPVDAEVHVDVSSQRYQSTRP